MPLFHFIALDPEDRWQRGEEEAINALAVRRLLESRGWKVTRVEEVLEPVFDAPLSSGEAAVVAQRVAEVARLNLPLESGLRAVAEEAPSRRLRSVLTLLASDMERGESLTDALGRREGQVPEHLLHLVRAGLETQTLALLLERYVQSVRRGAEIRRRMLMGLIYPGLIALGGAKMLIGFIVFVMPQFEQIFEDFDTSLPWMTSVLVGLSRFTRAYGIWLFLVLVLLGVLGVLGLMTAARTRFGRQAICSIPVFGPLLRLTALAEFASLLGQFIDARTELPQALELAGAGSGDAEIAWAAEGLANEVRHGVPLADAATMARGVPHPMRQMLRWSTHPKKFAEALFSAAEMCLARASVQATIVGPFLEPAALLGVGVTFGLLVVSVVSPLIKLLNDLS